MSILYIPSTISGVRLPQPNVPNNISDITETSGSIIQTAIEKAIQNTIVIPFKNWCFGLWSGFMVVSHYVCLLTAMGGVIFYICGIEKGKKVAIVAMLSYLGLQILNFVIIE